MARRRLEGRRILVLRPEGQAEDLVRALAAEGADAVVVRAIRILPLPDAEALDAALRRDHDWVIFTSTNGVAAIHDGVDAFALRSASITEAYAEPPVHPPDTRGASVFSSGLATTAARRRAGLAVRAEAGTHTIPGLVATIAVTMEV